MLPTLKRELALRLGVCGLVLALVAGVAATWLETARLDGLVRQLAVTQALHLVHALDTGPDHLSSARTGGFGGFVFLHIERAGTIVEHRAPSLAEPVRDRLDELIRQNGASDAHVNFTESGRDYMFLAFTQEETGAHFSGLFLIDEGLGGRMSRQVGWSALGVFLVVVLTTTALIPVILRLQNRVICHAQDAIDANIDALATLGSAIAKRDSDTDAHNYRVTIYALRLGEALGLAPRSIRNLIRGAFLHDVGKIGIPDAILLKPGPLTADEFEVMKTHVSHGLDIIAHSRWLGAAADVVGGRRGHGKGSNPMSPFHGRSLSLGAEAAFRPAM